jgi:hypothetical protein
MQDPIRKITKDGSSGRVLAYKCKATVPQERKKKITKVGIMWVIWNKSI